MAVEGAPKVVEFTETAPVFVPSGDTLKPKVAEPEPSYHAPCSLWFPAESYLPAIESESNKPANIDGNIIKTRNNSNLEDKNLQKI